MLLSRDPIGVDVDLSLRFMAHAGRDALRSWRAGRERAGGTVKVDGLDAAWSANVLERTQ